MNHDYSLLMIIQVKKLEHTDEILRCKHTLQTLQYNFHFSALFNLDLPE